MMAMLVMKLAIISSWKVALHLATTNAKQNKTKLNVN
jgi:hypothetical protein